MLSSSFVSPRRPPPLQPRHYPVVAVVFSSNFASRVCLLFAGSPFNVAPQISALLEFRTHHQLLRHSVSDCNCGPLLPYTGGQNYLAHFEALSHHCHVSYHTSRITTSEIKVGRGAISHDPPTDTSPHLLVPTNDFVARLIMDSAAHPRTEGCRYSFDVFDVSSTVEHVRDLDCHVRKCHAFCF